jgi:hypothetical protein
MIISVFPAFTALRLGRQLFLRLAGSFSVFCLFGCAYQHHAKITHAHMSKSNKEKLVRSEHALKQKLDEAHPATISQ